MSTVKNKIPNNLINIAEEINQLVNVTSLKTNMELKQNVDGLKLLVEKEKAVVLDEIVDSDKELIEEQVRVFKEIAELLGKETIKLNNLFNLNVINIKKMFEDKYLDQFLAKNKLDLDIFESLDQEKFEEISLINVSIDKIIAKNLELKQLTTHFFKYLNNIVKEKTKYINDFF